MPYGDSRPAGTISLALMIACNVLTAAMASLSRR